MITVSQATEKIINRSRYLSEAMSKGLINTSALARYIKPEIEQMLMKDISEAAVLMAINRLAQNTTPKYHSHEMLHTAPQMMLRSQLRFSTYQYSPTILSKLATLKLDKNSFLLLTKHTNISIVSSAPLEKNIDDMLKNETTIEKWKDVSTITIVLPKEAIHIPGVHYFFLKSLAWDGINILGIISVEEELTLVFEEKDVQNAYAILQSLFTS